MWARCPFISGLTFSDWLEGNLCTAAGAGLWSHKRHIKQQDFLKGRIEQTLTTMSYVHIQYKWTVC